MTIKQLTLAALATLAASASAEDSGTVPSPTSGSPLDLFVAYAPDVDGIHYDYQFTLTLTNVDASWTRGQGWGWITFDESTYPSRLNFVGDPNSLVGSPWHGFDFTSGDHSGYTLADTSSVWYPKAVGDAVSWSGVADIVLPSDFVWSALYPNGGASEIEDKAVLTRLATPQAVPEPTSLAGLTLCVMALSRRRRV